VVTKTPSSEMHPMNGPQSVNTKGLVIGSKAKVTNHDKPLSKKESCEITKLQEDS
jgi:hypothetical protein